MTIEHVSDTARWVAVYRAWESARPDALFNDPYAERLAGERGRAIAALAPRQARSGWPMIVRTRLMDDLVLASVAEGCDRVLNLAAGFDTRPYRLALPASLDWVEVDLPALVVEKERALAGETPVCRVSREQADLSEPGARSALLSRLTSGATKVLVITEGLLIYLGDEVVQALSRDLAGLPSVRFWLLDQASPVILRMMQQGMAAHLDNAPMTFAPANGVAFFEALGWQARDIRSVFHEGVRLRRVPWLLRPFALLPAADPRAPGRARWSAVVRLERR